MPVMRTRNFTDKTGDIALEQADDPGRQPREGRRPRHRQPARFPGGADAFMTLPGKGRIKGGSLLAPRDRHALVSAQATFLPIPQQGKATFWPVIFNYQSSRRTRRC
jgi:hypothetical protein